MKILYCTNQLKVHGGIERILSLKINSLIQDFNHDVYLLTYNQNQEKIIYSIDNRTKHFDLDINYIPNFSYFHPKNLIKTTKHFFRLKNAIKKIKPDIIVSVSYTPDQYFLPFVFNKIPKIKELHSSGIVVSKIANSSKGFLAFFKNKLINVLTKYDTLVLLNKDEKQYFPETNAIVINNFTDFKISNNCKKEKTIIAVGRIAAVKQFHELVFIWKKIHADYPDWKIKIFGNGDLKTFLELQKLITNFGLEKSFLILDSTENIHLEMEKASIYAMTSETECFPMVLLEAQICGLPIISYDCPNGPKNIINDDIDGFLIENYNQIQFAEKLSYLIQNEDKRLQFSKNSQINVKQFDKQKIMNQWNDLFVYLKK